MGRQESNMVSFGGFGAKRGFWNAEAYQARKEQWRRAAGITEQALVELPSLPGTQPTRRKQFSQPQPRQQSLIVQRGQSLMSHPGHQRPRRKHVPLCRSGWERRPRLL